MDTALEAFKYMVEGGFWHFIACFLMVHAVTKITTLVKVTIVKAK